MEWYLYHEMWGLVIQTLIDLSERETANALFRKYTLHLMEKFTITKS